MEVKLAKTAGFCMGVRRAVDIVLDIAQHETSRIYTYGPLIHNPQTIELLKSRGIRPIENIEEIKDKNNAILIIRAHGIAPDERKKIKSSGLKVVDATCPKVGYVQSIIKKHTGLDYSVIIVGDREHPEVDGLLGYTGGRGIIISTLEDKGMFRVAPPLELKKLEAIFRHKVFRMLLNRGKITKEMIAMLSTWRHSGFNVFCGNRILPKDETAMENLARYIIRASFSQERMRYLEQEGKVIYTAKDGRTSKNFPALEWLAAMCSHIPNRGEQMVRYYGYYSNVSRGKRKETGTDDAIPCILEPVENVRALRKSWARLIQKIYQVDPLVCPKCQGVMRIISFIEDQQVIRDILQHLGLWLVRSRPPPKIHNPPIREYANAFGGDMLRKPAGSATCPQNEPDMIYGDPQYSWDDYIQS